MPYRKLEAPMTTQLNLATVPSRGRRAKPVQHEYVRDMTEADVEALSLPAPDTMKAPEIQKLTERHHALARLLASGTTEQECAMILGYDRSRISVIKSSPAFQELMALYREEVDLRFTSIFEHMSGLSRDALLELRDRLEANADKFTNSELRQLVTDLTDRSARGVEVDDLPTEIELIAPSDDTSSA